MQTRLSTSVSQCIWKIEEKRGEEERKGGKRFAADGSKAAPLPVARNTSAALPVLPSLRHPELKVRSHQLMQSTEAGVLIWGARGNSGQANIAAPLS